MKARAVVIVAYPGVQPLDAVGPFEVFAGATRALEASGRAGGYGVVLASASGPRVRAESGLSLCTDALPDAGERIDTLVLAGGDGAQSARHDEGLISWISAVAPRCRRVAAVCTGAFLAAEAGLLDGRRVTTHWARAEQLATEFPSVDVDADPIYVRDGKFWTSAGVTAGIDLALALVQDDFGVDVGADRRPVPGHVPAQTGRSDPVRLARVGTARRAFDRTRRADPRRSGSGR